LTPPSPKSPTGVTSRHLTTKPHRQTSAKNLHTPNNPTAHPPHNPTPNAPTYQTTIITRPNKTTPYQMISPTRQPPRTPNTPCTPHLSIPYSHPSGMPSQLASSEAKPHISHNTTITQRHSTYDAFSQNNASKTVPMRHSPSLPPKKLPLQKPLQPLSIQKYVSQKNSSANKSNPSKPPTTTSATNA
jgi:hypothetical protein